jgi:hypothetical protein
MYLNVLKCKDHSNHYEYCHSLPSLPIVTNPLPSLPSLSAGSDTKQRKGATNILYGMDSGALSSVTVQPDGTHTHLWTVEEAAKRSPVTCTYCVRTVHSVTSVISKENTLTSIVVFFLSCLPTFLILFPYCCCYSSLSYSAKNSCVFLSF